MVTKFTRENLAEIRRAMEEALAQVTEGCGVTFDIGTMRYDEDTFKVTVEAKAYQTEEEADEKAKSEFAEVAKWHGVPTDAYGKVFKGMDGNEYKVIGINPKAPKNCMKVQAVKNGKTYKCQKEFIRFDMEV